MQNLPCSCQQKRLSLEFHFYFPIAGHCPHDEIPDEVNELIHDFVWSSEIASSNDSVVVTNREDTLPADAVDIIKEGVHIINEDILSSPLSKKK
jgi:hypothetical protein